MVGRRSVESQPGFILHTRPYRESSLLIELFSQDYGKVGLIAKGVRGRRSPWQGLLQPLMPLTLNWVGRSELQTLTEVDGLPMAQALRGRRLYCGLYLNELLAHFLHRDDPHPQLFAHYALTLNQLAAGVVIEPLLRYFEQQLLSEVGYGLQLTHEIKQGMAISAERSYCYQIESGPVDVGPVSRESNQNSIDGATLIALRQAQLDNPRVLQQAKQLLRRVIAFHMGGKPLQSRAIFTARSSFGR